MLLTVIIFGATSSILLFLLLLQKYENRNIVNQLRKIKTKDTNVLVHSKGSGKISANLINEINFLLQEVRHSKVCYQQKNHALERMMTNISHDLRTPLTSAMGYIQIIQNAGLTEEEKRRELAIVEKRLIRLEELINSFFEFSQVISSEKEPEKSECNMIAILEESIAHYFDDYCAKGREIVFQYSQPRLMLYSNKNMLLRIFDNLIGNALKHGIGNLVIAIELTETIQITFKNKLYSTDIDMNHIFDEFYTTDISRTKGNTGLGLAIVKQFVEMLGGTVSAELFDGMLSLTVVFYNRDFGATDCGWRV